MPRKKLKSATITPAAVTQTFDLRGDYLDGPPKNSDAIEIENPLNAAQKITVFRSLRDPLDALHNRGAIDECQFIAGRYWQKAYELAELSGLRGIDTTRDYVDGGQIAQTTVSDVQARAMQDLKRANSDLGVYGASLIFDVLARKMTIAQCAVGRMMMREAEVAFLSRRFGECLNTLAVTFRLTNGGD